MPDAIADVFGHHADADCPAWAFAVLSDRGRLDHRSLEESVVLMIPQQGIDSRAQWEVASASSLEVGGALLWSPLLEGAEKDFAFPRAR